MVQSDNATEPYPRLVLQQELHRRPLVPRLATARRVIQTPLGVCVCVLMENHEWSILSGAE